MLPSAPFYAVEWIRERNDRMVPGRVRLLDQTQLPVRRVFFETVELATIRTAIRTLQVRGAPAIGIAAAMGVAAALQYRTAPSGLALADVVRQLADGLADARPTAVNLCWALERMRRTAAANAGLPPDAFKERLAVEAQAIWDQDAAACRAIGRFGAELLKDGDTILTHCNAGRLAAAAWGTALAPVYVAREQGKTIRVMADETRPLLQGARLTAWELTQAGIEVTLICDNTAAQVMKEGRIGAVLVGADRIAANGDTANKIGTYGVAVLARAHRIPFFVLAPTSTFDRQTRDGDGIPIEQRASDEVIYGFGVRTAPENVAVYSPAFDVTPARLISAIICEKGILRPPYRRALRLIAHPSNAE